MKIDEVLLEISEWISRRNDKYLKIFIEYKNEELKIFINFFESTPDIPHLYLLKDKYVIVAENTSFHYKGQYSVDGVIDLKSNYLEFQRRKV